MDFSYFTDALTKKYADFSGRARRAEYWSFFLFNFVISIVLGGIAALIDFPLIGLLYSLAILVPGIAVAVRRMHDIGKSGWVLFVGLIPIVGAFVVLYWALQDSQREPNEYGPSPKYG